MRQTEHEETTRMYVHIVAATDFSAMGNRALLRAAELAILMKSKLTLLHVAHDEDTSTPLYAQHEVRGEIQKLEDKLRAGLGDTSVAHVDVSFVVRIGGVADQILQFVTENGADLIVLGAAGQKGLTQVLVGSVANRVVRTANVDVLVVTAR
jgi:nucleotide-binding universal stress UspA family protein